MILPESFTEYTERIMGDALYGRFVEAIDEEPPVSIRLNPTKTEDEPHCGQRVGWCSLGYYLDKRPQFTFDPLLHAGLYYVQEASSMFLHHVLRQLVTSPVRVLDLCAAPGGKTTTALGALPEGSVMVCNEPVRVRAQILAENIQKWGNPNVIVTNNYPKDYATSGLLFDVVVCDVPCSGEGMFRKDSEAVREWSVQNVEKCRLLQREIVQSVWPCLADGGLMVYSTCTFNTAEDEENVAWICQHLGADLVDIETEAEWNIVPSLLPAVAKPVYRFVPGVTRGEGLFMAVLRKHGDGDGANRAQTKRIKPLSTVKAQAPYSQWIDKPERFDFFTSHDIITAIPKPLSPLYHAIVPRMKVLHAGIELATAKGKDYIPHHSLALSTSLRRGAFPEVPVSRTEAISYLRREPVTLPSDAPRGFVLLTYRGHPIGFEKNLGNRANNLYPAEWKIKSSHVPTDEDFTEII